jgi:DNA-binding IscR family transcriptional regulator
MDKIDIATAVWNAIMLSNMDELKKLTPDARYAIMNVIYIAIKDVVNPYITLDEIMKEDDLIQKYVTAVYQQLDRMRITIIKGDNNG